MRAILETPEGRERAAEGLPKLVGAVCEIRTGRARLPDAPVTAAAAGAAR
jgi:hypothetical protein